MGFLEDIGESLISLDAMADRIVTGRFESEEEAELAMRLFLCRRYNIPLFDPYFQTLTGPQLYLETALHRLLDKPLQKRTADDVKKLTETDKNTLFDGMAELDALDQDPTAMVEVDQNFINAAQEFMKTGDFVKENKNGNE